MRKIEVGERRARLARRHRLAPGDRAGDVVEATRSMVCLHGTDPASVYLSAWMRVDGMAVTDMERALYVERSVVKHLAMRRTLFVFPRETIGCAQAAVSNRVADSERRRLIRDVETAGLQRDGARWLSQAWKEVLAALSDGREATSSELRDEIRLLEGSITYGEGKSWGGQVPVGPRVLTTLSAAGHIVRASNDDGWTTSRPRWASMKSWLGEEIAPPTEAEGTARLVERWLRTFGPGTASDIRWWLGSTVTAVRRALVDLHAVEVDLDGTIGYLLRDDVEATDPVEPWVALLPPLDPTTMGWFERDWYLGPYKAQLFDTSGNAGPTVWWDGRIVGGWRQSDTGEVVLQMLEDVGAEGSRALENEAARLTEWFGGKRVLPRFPSPLWKVAARGPVASPAVRILFVCMGNICRSPTAEGVLRGMVRDAGLEDRVEIDSAGTGDWHVGSPPDERSAAAALRRGIALDGAARQVTPEDLSAFDLVLAMDRSNLHALRDLGPEGAEGRVRLLREYDPAAVAAGDLDVPDPYYGGERGFDDVLDLVEAACRGLVGELRATLP